LSESVFTPAVLFIRDLFVFLMLKLKKYKNIKKNHKKKQTNKLLVITRSYIMISVLLCHKY